MKKKILLGVGGLSLMTAVYIGFATQHWYDNVPGVVSTGPLNFHFAQDVALAYLMSGGALLWAGLKGDRSAGICGAGWLVLHALLHIWMWMHRGIPLDIVALANLLGIQVPAFLALFAAINIKTGGKHS